MQQLRTLIFVAAGVTTASFLGLTAFGVHEVFRHDADLDWVEHTHAVLDQLEAARLQLKSAELALRSFKADGPAAQREGVRRAAESVRWTSEALQKLTTDNPAQSGRAEELATASAEIRASVENRGRTPLEGAAAAARAENVARSMEDAERLLLAERSRREKGSAAFALGALAAATLFAAVFSAAALVYIVRGLDERERLHATLARAVALTRALEDAPKKPPS